MTRWAQPAGSSNHGPWPAWTSYSRANRILSIEGRRRGWLEERIGCPQAEHRRRRNPAQLRVAHNAVGSGTTEEVDGVQSGASAGVLYARRCPQRPWSRAVGAAFAIPGTFDQRDVQVVRSRRRELTVPFQRAVRAGYSTSVPGLGPPHGSGGSLGTTVMSHTREALFRTSSTASEMHAGVHRAPD